VESTLSDAAGRVIERHRRDRLARQQHGHRIAISASPSAGVSKGARNANDRHWSASMLLEWVLSRDIEAVRSMANEYGGWRVDKEGAARIQPPNWDDVLRAHTIDESLPKDDKAREAVTRAKLFVIPARQEILMLCAAEQSIVGLAKMVQAI